MTLPGIGDLAGTVRSESSNPRAIGNHNIFVKEIENAEWNVLEANHIVYIGGKPTMNYVLAVATQFKDGTSIVIIKARGRSISKAVDVALIVQDRFVENTKVQGISIVTEELTDEGGQPTKVSSIEITLGKV